MSTHMLNCWVRSNDPQAIFPVNISKTDVVYDLQEAIKNMNPATFSDVDADTLTLYKPKDPLSKPYKENLGKFILAEHGEHLCGLDELSEVFPEPPSKHEIHIIVDAPSEIICYLWGFTLNGFFPIPMQPGEGIGRLSLHIIDVYLNLRSIASHLVHLYKTSGDENELQESLKKTGDGKLLENPLMSNFLGMPVLDPLRVVVESPEGALEDHKHVDDYLLGLMFPMTNLTSYNDNGIETSFTYTEQINENKLVFSAVVNKPSAKECIVKFTSQYSEATHEYLALASHGMAPKIWKCIQISSDWIAVIMEKSKYQVLYGMKLSKTEEEKVKHKVTNIVQTLHAGDFVHGDIRDSNLLIDHVSLTSEDVTVHLIDFDWAGRIGEVKYPEGINCKTVRHPKGVKAGELITQQHDDEMVSNLFGDEPFYQCTSSGPTTFAE